MGESDDLSKRIEKIKKDVISDSDVQRFLNDIEGHHSYLKRIENEKYNIDMNELKNLENNKIMNNLIIK